MPKYLLLIPIAVILYLCYDVKNNQVCTKMAESQIFWIERIVLHQWNVYSQSGEDGVIDTIFKNIGTTDKVYVEFGASDTEQSNTRYLREVSGWDVKNSLLMDGGFDKPDINLHQVIFWPSNIVEHFQNFGVKMEFDLLSIDTDSYDWFMIEAILTAGYRPRVIVTEVNSGFDISDAKSILPPTDGESWERWDTTAYHGTSSLALYYLFNRFGYSLVFCNYINCFAVRDELLGLYIRRPMSAIFVQNIDAIGGFNHLCDYNNKSFAIIDPSGKWLGEDDRGLGSSTIRHDGCAGNDRNDIPLIYKSDCCYGPTVEVLEQAGLEGVEYKCNMN